MAYRCVSNIGGDVLKIKVVDLFCGAGGETTGMIMAAEELGITIDLLAVNHWDVAIETHSTNYPHVKHMCESIQNVDPTKAIKGGRINLLWASPECTHHSVARGGRPRCDQSRASVWLILKWLQELYVDRVIIENVPEFINWGPLGANGKPMVSKRGETFKAFVTALNSLGYKVDWRILCAADYGDPTTRTRFFLQAVRGKHKIAWPQPSHSKNEDIFTSEKWIPASDIIDWNFAGKSIFDRKKPLAPNTINRIESGIKKFWGEWAEPFLVVLRGTGNVRDINIPLPTVTTSGAHFGLVEPLILHQMSGIDCIPTSRPLPTVTTVCGHALVEPFITAIGQTSSKSRCRKIGQPLSTVCTKQEHCLVEPFILPPEGYYRGNNPRRIDKPLQTVTTRGGGSIVRPFLMKFYGSGENVKGVDAPLDTVTTKDRFGIVEGDNYQLDIRFRMLQPHELAAAQGFPRGYKFSGNRTDVVKQIGNAVPCNLAKAITKAVLAA